LRGRSGHAKINAAMPRVTHAPPAAPVDRTMRRLARAIAGMELPAVEKISEEQAESPFQILIATLLSARTQDATTHAASTRLFARARSPRAMARLPVDEIERLIYPVGFYRNKARHVNACCEMLVSRFGGRVPSTLEELVTLPGVGRKTANLVLILAFKSRRNICVDTHVHRISNRLGWVRTTLPEETEQALYRATDARWWPVINLYMVTWGQNVCRPVHPRCGDCAIVQDCPRIGVRTTRNAAKAFRQKDKERRQGVPAEQGRPRARSAGRNGGDE
jgi:endonuclease III